jgi:signal peptidase I
MTRSWTSRRRVLAVLVLAVLVVPALWLGWPAQLGGKTAYVTTYGVSMEPAFHAGDLAITRTSDTYGVGDVVAYRSKTLRRLVLHRVVAVEDGRYTFQGDNNDFKDPDQPGQDSFVGTMVFRVPSGGIWLGRLTSPPLLAAIAFLVLVAGGGTVMTVRRSRRRRRPVTASHTQSGRPSLLAGAWSPQRILTGVLAGIVLLGVGLGVLAWTGPVDERTEAPPETRSMDFAYSAPVGRTPAYDGTTVHSPDPVFRKVVDAVNVQFTYRGKPGEVAVDVELSTSSGWHSTVRLAPPKRFSDDRYVGTVRLDLSALAARAEAAARTTGVPAGQLVVNVVPRIATSDGEDFAPRLELNLNQHRLALASESELTVEDSAPGKPGEPTARWVSIGGLDLLPAALARAMSIGIVLVCLAGGVLLLSTGRARLPVNEGADIRRRYAQLLVRVDPIPLPPERPVVDVVEFKTLARLAERYGLLVLYWSDRSDDTFVVQDNGMTYRYRTITMAVEAALA